MAGDGLLVRRAGANTLSLGEHWASTSLYVGRSDDGMPKGRKDAEGPAVWKLDMFARSR